jgi:CHAT domain-containing protein/tetratricopeptide (TPR) repeat protein
MIVAGYVLHGAQPPPKIGRSQWLDEVTRLEQQVQKLRDDGKFQDAIPLAERSLALREAAQGPTHPEVARGVADVAALYREQGVYDKAEPLALRALDIREKTFGPRHLDVADSLDGLGEIYSARGLYSKAEPLLVRALDIREKALGATHADVGHTLNDLGLLHHLHGAFDKAKPLYLRALEIREKALGAMHAVVAESVNNLGGLYSEQGAYEEAKVLYARALAIEEKARGPTHPLVATDVNNLAVSHWKLGEFREAEPLFRRALAIREKALGPLHPDVATSLNNLGGFYKATDAFDKAEPLYLRALDIREKTLGSSHPDVAITLGNLVSLYLQTGAYGKAEPVLIRALEIRENAFGPMHADVGMTLGQFAVLYRDQGSYGKAEPLLVRALDIYEKALGPAHSEVARGLSNLAALYKEQGAYSKAEPLFARALAIREKALGPMHPAVAEALHHIADLHRLRGAPDKAEPLAIRALEIREKALGPMHSEVASDLSTIAALYVARGAYREAKALLIRALAIREKALGPNHLDVAASLSNLGALHQAQLQYRDAERLLVRALDIEETTLGPKHPRVASALNSLAGLHRARGAYDKAEPLHARAAEIREAQLHDELARLSEPRKRALMRLLQRETDSLVSLHADAMPSHPRALELALTTTLRRKGRVLDSSIDNEAALRAHLTPKLRDQLDQLTRARAELTSRLYSPAGSRSTNRAAIEAIRANIEELESALSAASAEFRVRSEPVTVANVQAGLPADAALVEFVRYHRFDPREAQPWQEQRYAAYLVTSRGAPQWVALGAAAPIDAAIDVALATMDDRTPAVTARAALRHLDALVFAPVRARLTGVSHVILAPDSKLNLVPFEALVDPRGQHAVQNYLVSYLTSGRDLLALAPRATPRSPAVIVAAPDYGPLPPPGTAIASFTPLSGALGEAADLQSYFLTPPVTGERATKSALSALAGPALVHVATHGFYARSRPQPRSASPSSSRDIFGDGLLPLEPPSPTDDPADGLDHSGLAMAGANRDPSGIVTAREIAGFDWWGTQLVVLSGCETGVGAVPSGEGVYGMRRALVLAGTASQVVSLWGVDDASTRKLMRNYYAELARGTGRAEALRRAKLELLRQNHHPYYWAGFIPAGDWRALDDSVFSGRSP